MPLQAMNLRVPRSPVLRRNSACVTMRSGAFMQELYRELHEKNLPIVSGDFLSGFGEFLLLPCDRERCACRLGVHPLFMRVMEKPAIAAPQAGSIHRADASMHFKELIKSPDRENLLDLFVQVPESQRHILADGGLPKPQQGAYDG